MPNNRSKQSALNVLTGLISAKHEYTKAQMDFKKEMLLDKIKQRASEKKQESKYNYEMKAEENKAMIPFKMMEKYGGQMGGQYEPNITGMKKITPDDRLNSIIMKNQGIPEDQWSVEDKLFIQNYQRVKGVPIIDRQGNVINVAPKGSRFQPKDNGEDTSFLGGTSQPQTTQSTVTQPSEQHEFNSPTDADNSGLPTGTIVLVGGRKYQI